MDSSRPFRGEDWWIGKASLLVGLVYLFSIYFSIPFRAFGWYSFLSLATIIGFASFGYLVNDFFDQAKDAIAGKKNFLLGKPIWLKALYCLTALVILFTPWYFLPHDRVTWVLISAQLCAYFIYSVPPLRLKERGAAGLIADSLYAHAIPAILAAYTYTLIAGRAPSFIFFGLLFCWQACAGIRNVLLHQLTDLDSDHASGTHTYLKAKKGPSSHRASPSVSAATIWFMPYLKAVEFLFLILLLLFLCRHDILFTLSIAGLVIGTIGSFMLDERSEYRYYFPNLLYDQWLPYSYILILAVSDVRFLLLLPIQALLFTFVFFRDQYSRIPFTDYYDHSRRLALFLFIKFKILVNWLIYLVFRLIGINLIKEKTDARGYILKKVNKQK